MPNLYEPIDLASMALQLGASFVGRSFSGDKRQLVPLVKAGLMHPGMAFLDVISPCVAFNNHNGSTKSFQYVREHSATLMEADYIAPSAEITADYEPGAAEDVRMPDGSTLRLRKVDAAYDVHDRIGALAHAQRCQEQGEVLTGLLYVDPDAADCHDILETVETPLNELTERDLCPGNGELEKLNESFR